MLSGITAHRWMFVRNVVSTWNKAANADDIGGFVVTGAVSGIMQKKSRNGIATESVQSSFVRTVAKNLNRHGEMVRHGDFVVTGAELNGGRNTIKQIKLTHQPRKSVAAAAKNFRQTAGMGAIIVAEIVTCKQWRKLVSKSYVDGAARNFLR